MRNALQQICGEELAVAFEGLYPLSQSANINRKYEWDAFLRASDLILREFKKLCGEFVAIGLTKITCPVEEVVTVNLSSNGRGIL